MSDCLKVKNNFLKNVFDISRLVIFQILNDRNSNSKLKSHSSMHISCESMFLFIKQKRVKR